MEEKHAGGRPTVMTPEVVSKLEEAFSLGCTDIEACLLANISRVTLYKYQAKNPEFVDRKEELKETPILKARTAVVDGLDDNPEFSLKYLERKKKKEFSLRTELTGADGKDLPSPLLANIPNVQSNNGNSEDNATEGED